MECCVEKNWQIISIYTTYFIVSQCIRAIRKPGNVNKAPRIPHPTAMKNLTTILEAGPLELSPCVSKKDCALSLKLL